MVGTLRGFLRALRRALRGTGSTLPPTPCSELKTQDLLATLTHSDITPGPHISGATDATATGS